MNTAYVPSTGDVKDPEEDGNKEFQVIRYGLIAAAIGVAFRVITNFADGNKITKNKYLKSFTHYQPMWFRNEKLSQAFFLLQTYIDYNKASFVQAMKEADRIGSVAYQIEDCAIQVDAIDARLVSQKFRDCHAALYRLKKSVIQSELIEYEQKEARIRDYNTKLKLWKQKKERLEREQTNKTYDALLNKKKKIDEDEDADDFDGFSSKSSTLVKETPVVKIQIEPEPIKPTEVILMSDRVQTYIRWIEDALANCVTFVEEKVEEHRLSTMHTIDANNSKSINKKAKPNS